MWKRSIPFMLALMLLAGWCLSVSGIPEARAQEARAKYALRAVNLAFEVDAAQFQREMERYNAAISRFEGAALLAGPPKAADPDGRIRQTLDDLAAQEQPFTLSMDGRKLFTVQNQVPSVYHLDRGLVTLLAPGDTMSQAYYHAHYRRLLSSGGMAKGSHEGGFAWSPDGNYLLMTFIKEVLRVNRAGINALLADIATGTIQLIDPELPEDAEMNDAQHQGGFPVRGCFHPSEPVAYVEYYGAYGPGDRTNQIKAHHLRTGAVELLSEYPTDLGTMDPGFWYTKAGIAHSILSIWNTEDRQAGLALHSLAGETRMYTSKQTDERRQSLEPRLLSASGAWAAVQQQTLLFGANRFPVQLISLDTLVPQDLELALVVHLPAGQEPQLLSVPMQYLDAHNPEGRPSPILYDDSYFYPVNAVFSPDGRFVMLPVRPAFRRGTAAMFLYDMARQELFSVDLPDLQRTAEGNYGEFGGYDRTSYMPFRGIRLLHNNLLLIADVPSYHLFELTRE